METKNERIFAYTMAKILDRSDLNKVSGGTAQATYLQTCRATGSNASDMDTLYDVTPH
ncbi:hypothetical protein [Legionella hackeliae]|uniref:Uncharacterized protein n=1 Tax=Legionella hackeliae TaxID=449 RepID=A0A0A8UZM7_LEGHA|nr:hypothetical protein [Legionella hackeliae]KTD12795.1 hypothetical protein Lhac_1666 [Legionella hackeliae]CEK12219.1 protein of unknown function [Legionella hackeliae]STX49005.1 Uncharacterised protein [Legionella hackeliae]